MPSIASHIVVAKLVGSILNINNDDRINNGNHINTDAFLLGNVLPDIIESNNSHYKMQGKYYLIPDIDKFIKENTIDNKDVFLGYLTHLLLDKYFLDEFIINNIKDYDKIDLFIKGLIYDDYSCINFKLVKMYKINTNNVKKVLNNCKYTTNKDKINVNIKHINCKENGKPKYIKLDKYVEFLEEISIRIADEIKGWC